MVVLKHGIEHPLPAPPEVMAKYYESLPSPPDAYGVSSAADAIAIRRAVPNKQIVILYPVEAELVRRVIMKA